MPLCVLWIVMMPPGDRQYNHPATLKILSWSIPMGNWPKHINKKYMGIFRVLQDGYTLRVFTRCVHVPFQLPSPLPICALRHVQRYCSILLMCKYILCICIRFAQDIYHYYETIMQDYWCSHLFSICRRCSTMNLFESFISTSTWCVRISVQQCPSKDGSIIIH